MKTLRQAAGAVVDSWDATYIAALRTALEAPEPEPEPVLYQRRMKADWSHDWTEWVCCSKETFKDILAVPYLHDWVYQARALYAAPLEAPENQVLQAKCDAFFANTLLALDDLEAMTTGRDAYQRAADDMAMSHKVERDALLLANLDLKNWFDALKADHDKLMAAGKLAHAYIKWSAHGNWRASYGQIPTAEEVIAALKAAGVQ